MFIDCKWNFSNKILTRIFLLLASEALHYFIILWKLSRCIDLSIVVYQIQIGFLFILTKLCVEFVLYCHFIQRHFKLFSITNELKYTWFVKFRFLLLIFFFNLKFEIWTLVSQPLLTSNGQWIKMVQQFIIVAGFS